MPDAKKSVTEQSAAEQSAAKQALAERMVFRATHQQPGRHVAIRPGNSAMRHLAYGRILLRAEESVSFATGDRETGLICLSGRADVTVEQQKIALERYDSIYIPRDSSVAVSTDGSVDLAEISADVAKRYPLQIARAADLAKDSKLDYRTGGAGCTRHIRMALGTNIEAGRLIAGITQSEPGNWTSWPPHEHAAMLEEIYVYIEMPAPGFGVQLVYDQQGEALATVVREGDAVLIPRGFHPNVSVPGHRICFLWLMAAHREGVDRQYGVVNFEPGFGA
jgi:5-deoxy-glucuronate isomerase